MMKQTSKQILTMLAFVLPLFGMVSAAFAPVRAQSVVTAIVTDPLTGIALGGLDPVTYFTEGAPQQGSADFEYVWKGAPWHFVSAANRDIFKGKPEVYSPQFGGHGLTGVSRGYLSDSDPRLFVIYRERLYLFYSAANREAFLLSPDAAARDAAVRWPELEKTLSVR